MEGSAHDGSAQKQHPLGRLLMTIVFLQASFIAVMLILMITSKSQIFGLICLLAMILAEAILLKSVKHMISHRDGLAAHQAYLNEMYPLPYSEDE